MENTYIAPNATVVGDVRLAKNVNVWYGAVLRGDNGAITIAEGSNVQDNAVIHNHTTVGKYCTIGHGAILHGCTMGDCCIAGMGSIILDGAVLEEGCLVGAGALVTGKTHAQAGSVLLGSPAKIQRILIKEEYLKHKDNADHYIRWAQNTFGK